MFVVRGTGATPGIWPLFSLEGTVFTAALWGSPVGRPVGREALCCLSISTVLLLLWVLCRGSCASNRSARET